MFSDENHDSTVTGPGPGEPERAGKGPAGELVAPTAEMRWWRSRLGGLVYPKRRDHLLARTIRFALVTPLAHFANLSFEFQSYLYELFHRKPLARLGHTLTMPVIIIALLAAIAHHSGSVAPTMITAGLLGAWYVIQATVNGMALLGCVMMALAGGFAAIALTWHHALPNTPALWAEPLFWLLGGVMLQTLSHAAEPDIPPRVSGTDDWVSVGSYFSGSPEDRLKPGQVFLRLVRAGMIFLFGMGNELWGSWRLMPVVVVNYMWLFGYQPERHRRLKALIHRASDGGNPAIDFIGKGGARSHDEDAKPCDTP